MIMMIESKCGQQITFDIHKLSLRRGDSQVYLDFEKKLPDKIVYLKFNNMCNLNCSYCFQKNEEKSKYLAINIEKNLIDTLVDAHSIYLFGGEPFLKINYKNIEQIVELCLKMNKKLFAFTNGVFNEEYFNLFRKYNDIFSSFTITIDGPKKLHDKRRILIGGSSYDRIISNMRELDLIGINFSIQINIDNENIKELSKLIRNIYDNKLNSHQIILNRVLHSNKSITELELLNLSVELKSKFKDINFNINCPTLKKVKDFFFNHIISTHRCEVSSTYVIDFQNKVIYACPENNNLIIAKFEKDVDYDISVRENIEFYNEKKECQSCLYKFFCGKGCIVDKDLKVEGCIEDVQQSLEYIFSNWNKFFSVDINDLFEEYTIIF